MSANFIYLIKNLVVFSLLISVISGCTDKHEPASCPPDCPEGITSSSITETDQYMMGEWQVFTRQINADNASELQGTMTIDNKISDGLYGGIIKGEARAMSFDFSDYDCSEKEELTFVYCSDKEMVLKVDWNVTLGMSTDGIELTISFPYSPVSIYMDVHENYIGRSLGVKFSTGEETYLMGKIINGKSPLDTMDTRTIKMN
ncbi:hypothetical protein GCM10007916_12660 [Psychromonas marina]|uniref:Lipocalin-like domain-containing protein n=1 Tax=Psychromonas marina TaxID=88364 RepID=A0ABQ6DYF9_9GAMM|nr:hypothetical protein [Psychromonas marina]GLS90199.1 hypothetical protein GCM10007916_12660 [Psychromonas marina]